MLTRQLLWSMQCWIIHSIKGNELIKNHGVLLIPSSQGEENWSVILSTVVIIDCQLEQVARRMSRRDEGHNGTRRTDHQDAMMPPARPRRRGISYRSFVASMTTSLPPSLGHCSSPWQPLPSILITWSLQILPDGGTGRRGRVGRRTGDGRSAVEWTVEWTAKLHDRHRSHSIMCILPPRIWVDPRLSYQHHYQHQQPSQLVDRPTS